jgi:hypothetical protein
MPVRSFRAPGFAALAVLSPLSTVLALALGAALALPGCAGIEKAKPEEAVKLAELRADLEQDEALVQYLAVRKKELAAKGEDPDQLDTADPEVGKNRLRAEERFKKLWNDRRSKKFEAEKEHYANLASDVVRKCTELARVKQSAVEVDHCVKQPPEANYDPVRAVLICALVIVLGLGGLNLYRSARRRIDPVAQAGQKLGLSPQQSHQQTTLSGEYKGYAIKIEASAPEVGQGDGYLRAIVLSKVDPHTVVRFGPLAPPTGLDLPDLDAPEVHDARIPEGYKMRLSAGTDGEALLSGDIGFQLRAFDPADIRVHDGMAALTCWQVPGTPEKVTEFIELAVTVARQYGVT